MLGDDADFLKIFGHKPTPLRLGATSLAATLTFNTTFGKGTNNDAPFIYGNLQFFFKFLFN